MPSPSGRVNEALDRAEVRFTMKALAVYNSFFLAAFDTRISTADVNSAVLGFFVKTFGYAAKPIADRLQKKGGRLSLTPEGFFELLRAAAWAEQLVKGQ